MLLTNAMLFGFQLYLVERFRFDGCDEVVAEIDDLQTASAGQPVRRNQSFVVYTVDGWSRETGLSSSRYIRRVVMLCS